MASLGGTPKRIGCRLAGQSPKKTGKPSGWAKPIEDRQLRRLGPNIFPENREIVLGRYSIREISFELTLFRYLF